MAIKTFTTGELLTASDTNTYLANSGLVYVKSQTIGSAVTSVVVSSAFSADFDSYKIIISGGSSVANVNLAMQFGAKTTNYKSQLLYAAWNNTNAALGSTTATSLVYVGNATTSGIFANIEVVTPFDSAKNTFMSSVFNSPTESGPFMGQTADTVSYTAFTIISSSAMTGGTITVYGYRKA
jgi:hypothetical protein